MSETELTPEQRIALKLFKITLHGHYEGVEPKYTSYSMGRVSLTEEGRAFMKQHLPEPFRMLAYA